MFLYRAVQYYNPTLRLQWEHYLKVRLHGASYRLANLTVAGFTTGQQLLDRQLDWPFLYTQCQL